MSSFSKLTYKIIGSAIEVHKELGPGHHSRAYQKAVMVELAMNNIPTDSNIESSLHYKGHLIDSIVADLLVEEKIIVHISRPDIDEQENIVNLKNLMKTLEKDHGFLFNFNQSMLEWKRVQVNNGKGFRLSSNDRDTFENSAD